MKRFSEYLKVADAAKFLGVSISTLRNWDNSGKFEAQRHPVNGYRLYKLEILKSLARRAESRQ